MTPIEQAREQIKRLIDETASARDYFGGKCDAARDEIAGGNRSKGAHERRFDAGVDAAALAIRERALRDALGCLKDL